MKFRKWFVTILAVSALAFMLPLDADAQVKKGGGKKGGSKSSGSKSGGSKSSGSRSGGSKTSGSKSSGSRSGGKVSSPPKRSSGGSRSGTVGSGRSSGRSTTVSIGGTRTSGGRTSTSTSRGRPTTTRGTLSKRGPSRSGRVKYDTKSNTTLSTSRTRTPVRIPNAPTVGRASGLDRAVYRENRVVANSPYRTGYHHYSPYFVDDYFYYPHYAFDYRPGYCAPSPFYYYHHLPGYVSYARITFGNFSFSIFAHNHYTWHRPIYASIYSYPGRGSYDSRRYTDLDYAVDDIVKAFERGRISYMEDLLPRDRFVQVAMEDYTEYRMRSDDFYDMMADLVEGTETRRYHIREVRYERNQAVVYAEHEYRDPWGRIERQFHTIVLSETRNGFEIEYFKVDRKRSW